MTAVSPAVAPPAPVPAPAAAGGARQALARFPAGAASVAVSESTPEALLEDIGARLSHGAGFAVATLNLDHLVKLGRDPAFRAAYAAHTHVTADGNPVVWLSRLAGTPVGLVTGADLVRPLAALAARLGVPVALVGATSHTLDAAAERLMAENPGLAVPVRIAPGQGFDPDGAEADAILARLADGEARLVLLALGAPRQERLAARALAAMPGTGFVSIGAGLDFIAGSQARAPAWARRLALEWLWRVVSAPRRLGRRYLDCVAILPRLAAHALAERRRRR